MSSVEKDIRLWNKVLHFFPFQLLLLHIKHNHVFLIIWALMFALVSKSAALKYGVPYLLLAPEYLNDVGFWSHAILGFSVGGFIMAFNIYTYMMYSFKFPFIATIARPFLKFNVNNFILPLSFVLFHLICLFLFQRSEELLHVEEVVINVFGYICGLITMLVVSTAYFFRTNKDVFRIRPSKSNALKKALSRFLLGRRSGDLNGPAVQTAFSRKRRGEAISFEHGWTVHTYLTQYLRVRVARTPEHYDENTLRSVFQQNHLNASLYEIVLIISFFAIGSLRDNPVFIIPAGASIFLFFTLLVMMYSVVFSYLRWWTPTVVIVGALLFNILSADVSWLTGKNEAYGLNYSGVQAEYSLNRFRQISAAEHLQNDMTRELEHLNNWRAQFPIAQKPPMILLNVSGGGLRATIWSFRVLQVLDSLTEGDFLKHTHVISGSSGGMMGAAFFRELYLRRLNDPAMNIYNPEYLNNLGSDILNPVALSIATTDLFIRYQYFNDGKYQYGKDRGHAFEQKYNSNTQGMLENKRLRDYTVDEYRGRIPMMFFSPTIVNDGRRLIIASQPVSYLSRHADTSRYQVEPHIENIEFTRLLQDQDAWNLRFTSAIRMSATFPYVMPMVSLPTNPATDAMDAGLRDNMGLKLALQYLSVFKDWISAHTGRVIIVRIRDSERFKEPTPSANSVLNRVGRPFGSLYGNFITTQEYDTDQMFDYFMQYSGLPVTLIEIQLKRGERGVSLSWHLTEIEKRVILNDVFSEQNIKIYAKLQALFDKRD